MEILYHTQMKLKTFTTYGTQNLFLTALHFNKTDDRITISHIHINLS